MHPRSRYQQSARQRPDKPPPTDPTRLSTPNVADHRSPYRGVHVGNVEDCIGSGAPARPSNQHKVGHRRAFRSQAAWSLVILKRPTPLRLDQHANSRALPRSDPKSPYAGGAGRSVQILLGRLILSWRFWRDGAEPVSSWFI